MLTDMHVCLPRPLREISSNLLNIAKKDTNSYVSTPSYASLSRPNPSQAERCLHSLLGFPKGETTFAPTPRAQAEKVIKVAFTVSLAALGALTLYSFGLQLTASKILIGGVLSAPATAMLIGSKILFSGANMLVQSVSQLALTKIISASIYTGLGYLMLEHYDFFSFGFLEEEVIEPSAQRFAPRLVQHLQKADNPVKISIKAPRR